jgi:hypothetical protein
MDSENESRLDITGVKQLLTIARMLTGLPNGKASLLQSISSKGLQKRANCAI